MADPQVLLIEIKFDGSSVIAGDKGPVETKDGDYIQRFQVDQKMGMPDYFSVQLQMGVVTDILLLDKIKPGTEVEMKVGYGTEGTIFKGEVSYCEPHFAAGEMFVTVSGYDGSHRLTRGTSSRTFGDGHEVNQNFGTVLGTLIGDSKGGKGGGSDGLSADAGSTESQASYIAHYNSSLYEIISRVGGSFGLDWNSGSHENGKTLTLKAVEKSSKVLTIFRETPNPNTECQAVSADFLCSTVKQVSKVVVRGWDTAAKKPILGKSESLPLVIGGTPGFEQAGKAHFGSSSSGRVLEVVDIPVANVGEANEVAAGTMSKLSMDWMTASVVIEGRPELHAGVIVELKQFGTRYSGEYLVEGCNHVYIAASGHSYLTYLSLARNGSPEP